jgi:formylglycine-generating enzyme required for sulfatase activity
MGGNVWEWTRSLERPYPYDPLDGREGIGENSKFRVVRGGSFFLNFRNVRCAFRYRFRPVERVDLIGFRVVLSPFSSDL